MLSTLFLLVLALACLWLISRERGQVAAVLALVFALSIAGAALADNDLALLTDSPKVDATKPAPIAGWDLALLSADRPPRPTPRPEAPAAKPAPLAQIEPTAAVVSTSCACAGDCSADACAAQGCANGQCAAPSRSRHSAPSSCASGACASGACGSSRDVYQYAPVRAKGNRRGGGLFGGRRSRGGCSACN